MPGLPLLRFRDLQRALGCLGFAKSHRKAGGSHRVFHNPTTRRTATVPDHGGTPIPAGTLKNIMRQAGITESELMGALE